MARKVFFSFHYDRDSWRVAQVRNSNVVRGYEKNPFYDKAQWETLKRSGQTAIKNWIDAQLSGTSVTVVLVGKETGIRPWVKYEVERSIALGKGLIAVDISKVKDRLGQTEDRGPNPVPSRYPLFCGTATMARLTWVHGLRRPLRTPVTSKGPMCVASSQRRTTWPWPGDCATSLQR